MNRRLETRGVQHVPLPRYRGTCSLAWRPYGPMARKNVQYGRRKPYRL